jgi:AAA-like domain
MSEQTEFFIDGGTLPPDAPSYVTRPADQELLEKAQAGKFCYVLTARQMGKSSLMERTARSLRAYGIKTAVIDLTGIGTVSINEWFLGLLTNRHYRKVFISWQRYRSSPALIGVYAESYALRTLSP